MNPQFAALHSSQLKLSNSIELPCKWRGSWVAYLLAVDKSGESFQVLAPPPIVENARISLDGYVLMDVLVCSGA